MFGNAFGPLENAGLRLRYGLVDWGKSGARVRKFAQKGLLLDGVEVQLRRRLDVIMRRLWRTPG